MSNEFDMDVVNVVTVKQGRKQRPEEQIDIYEIPYRNDDLIIHSGKYKPYIQEFDFILRNPALIPLINTWLSGRGKLQLENDFEEFGRDGFYMASVVEGWTYEKVTRNTYSFTVKFKVDPFFYYSSGQQKKTYITQPVTIYNNGTIYSEPYIRINGSGNITLTVNSQVITLTDIHDYIELDSALVVAYKDTLNQGSKMIGDFPILDVGKNNISWTGNVTSIEYKSKARELG
jgi:phage-related protein